MTTTLRNRGALPFITLLCVLGSSAPSARANWPGTGAVGSLGQLSPSAASFVASRGGSVGVAVFNNKTGKTYTYNPFWGVRVASTVKIGIMAAVIGRAQREGRLVNAWEKGQLWPMITQSDNNAATTLWNYIGAANVRAYVRSIGSNLVPDSGSPNSWGYCWASAYDMLKLVSKIQYGQLWSADKHAYALSLMRSVTSWQAFLRAGLPSGTSVAEKCGWYNEPESGTWRVHSVGAVNAGGSSYTIAIMTRYPGGWGMGYGQATIRGIASRVHAAFLASGTTTTTTSTSTWVMYRLKLLSNLNVRSGPGTNYARVGTLANGTVVDVYGVAANGWYKIVYGGGWRYIINQYVEKIGLSVQATSNLNVRTGPGTGYAKAGMLAVNSVIHAWESSNGWYKVYYNGAWRWILALYTKKV